MSVVQPNFNFDISKTEQSVEIGIKPPSAGALIGVKIVVLLVIIFLSTLLISMVLFLWIGAFFLPDMVRVTLFALSPFAVTGYLFLKQMQANKEWLRPAMISIDARGITLNGKTYLRQHIGQIFVSAPEGREIVIQERTPSSILGDAARRSVERRAFGVKMVYAADHVKLIDALPQPTAEAVYREITAAFAKFA